VKRAHRAFIIFICMYWEEDNSIGHLDKIWKK
jgi:hypothetical protein